MRNIITAILLLVVVSVEAQKVKYTTNRNEATLKIYVVNNRLEADLIIYKTYDMSRRKSGVWVIVKNRLEADHIIWEASIRNDSEYTVYYTNNINEVKSN